MTEEQKRKVSDLRRAGMGYTETARLAGVSRDAVRSFCRRNGLAGQAAQDGQEDAQAQEGICRECGKPLQQTAGVLLQGVPGEVVARASGADKAEGGVFLHLRRVRGAV